MPSLPEGFDQRLLWVDPLQKKTDIGAVLRAEEVAEYVDKYNLIIDRDNFNPEHLKGASYSMSPDRSEAWIVKPNGHREQVDRDTDARGEYFIVAANSFVFIRLRQLLRMPYYLIGRFNLKIRYVYRGLLLGTGPHIDPGYIGRIYIPLHNFTNEPVNIYIDDSFVSFEFARTTPIRLEGEIPTTLDEFYARYEKNLHLIDRRKIQQRNNLEAYLEGGRPYSALGVLVEQLRDAIKNRRYIDIGTVVAVVVLVGTYAASTAGLFTSVNDREHRLQEQIQNVSEEQSKPQANLKAQVDTLSEQIRQVTEKVEAIKMKQDTFSSPSATPKPRR